MMDCYVGRKRSCCECRKSKARCSLGMPCRRCEERSLQCKYTHAPGRPSVRRLRPVPELRAREEHANPRPVDQWDARVETSIDLSEPSTSVMEGFHSSGQESAASSTSIFQDPNPSIAFPMNWNTPAMPSSPSHALGCNLTAQAPAGEMPDLFGLSFLAGLQSPKGLQPSRPLTAVPRPDQIVTETSPPISQERPSPAAAHAFYDEAPLAPRVSNTVANCFSARVLLGQLFSYPKMFGHGGKLPPFIFPPCAMDGLGPSAECCAPGYHQCLPEALAICAGLIRSYETRTSGNTSFLWKNIYSEVERLAREVSFLPLPSPTGFLSLPLIR